MYLRLTWNYAKQFNTRRFHYGPNYTLQWHRNERDSVWNHQPHDCSLKRLFRRRSMKTSKFRVSGLCEENSPVNSRTKGQLRWKCFHLMFMALRISRRNVSPLTSVLFDCLCLSTINLIASTESTVWDVQKHSTTLGLNQQHFGGEKIWVCVCSIHLNNSKVVCLSCSGERYMVRLLSTKRAKNISKALTGFFSKHFRSGLQTYTRGCWIPGQYGCCLQWRHMLTVDFE